MYEQETTLESTDGILSASKALRRRQEHRSYVCVAGGGFALIYQTLFKNPSPLSKKLQTQLESEEGKAFGAVAD